MHEPANVQRLTLIEIGDSVGFILPDDMVARLDLEPGDELSCEDIRNGISLSMDNSGFDRQMRIARRIMARDRDILAKLAKS